MLHCVGTRNAAVNKMPNRILNILLGYCLLLWGAASQANFVSWQDDQQGNQWRTQESTHFIIHYQQAQQRQAVKSLNIAECVHEELTEFFDYSPAEKTTMVLVDDFDFSNGWATFFPFAQIRLFSSPPDSINSLEVNDDWLHTLIRHEYVHILHMEMAKGSPEEMRSVFGRFLLLYPHVMTPSFMLEGLAVYLETDAQKGYGRLQGSYYDMQMRIEVASAELKSLGQVATALREWPLGSNYLYGAYFFEFLDQQYGKEKIQQYLTWYSTELLPAVMQNSRMRRTTGQDFEDLWPEYQQWLRTRFEDQIKAIDIRNEGQGLAAGERWLNYSLMPMVADNQRLLLVKNNGEDQSQVVSIEAQDVTAITDSKNILTLDVNADGSLLTTRLIPHINGQAWSDIFIFNAGEWQQLTDKQRFRRARWVDTETIIAARIVRGISELHRIDLSGQSQLLWQGKSEETVLGDFSIAPGGHYLVASLKRPQQGWNLEEFDISAQQWSQISDTKGIENSPRILADHSILYSADYDGIYNLMLLDPEYKTVKQLTSVLSGAFRPEVVAGKLYFQHYGEQGFDIRHGNLAEYVNAPVKEMALQSLQGRFNYPAAFNGNVEISEPEEYQPWSSLQPHWWFPSWFVTEEYAQYGFQTSGSDALGRHNYSLFFAYDFDNLLADTNVSYLYDNRYLVDFTRKNDYIDIINNREPDIIVEQDRWLLARLNIVNFFEDQLSLNAGIVNQRDKLIHIGEGISAGRRKAEKTLAGLAWRFDSRRAFINSPGLSAGNYWDLVVESHDILNSDFSGNLVQGQWQGIWDLPGRQKISARLLAGFSSKDAEPFTIGGESPLTDELLFGRDDLALRGYEDQVQGGNRYQLNRLSYGRWLGRIEDGWGIWPIGAGDLSASVFVDSGAAWFEQNEAEYLTGVGFELNLEVVGFYRLLLPLKLGYAKGLDNTLGKEQLYFGLSLPTP